MITNILLISLGFLTNIALGIAYHYYEYYKFYKENVKLTVPTAIDESKLCKGTHSWLTVSAVSGGESKDTQVCRICGLVSGTDKMATPEFIDKAEEISKVSDIEKRMWKEFVDKEDEQMKRYLTEELNNGLSFEKIITIHEAGSTINQRFQLYLLSKREDIEKELNRSN